MEEAMKNGEPPKAFADAVAHLRDTPFLWLEIGWLWRAAVAATREEDARIAEDRESYIEAYQRAVPGSFDRDFAGESLSSSNGQVFQIGVNDGLDAMRKEIAATIREKAKGER